MHARHVAVVPHTHWDREWYEPFQTFRLKLVDLLDELIPLLESDPSYSHYMLDGQMAVIDDYLEVRPEMADRLRRLAASGRVSVGPWYILIDEFLVSGETIIRDLQLGIERGAAFGGVTTVGYLPDMFGHISQMPQILRQAGFEHTVLWRGVPSAITKTGFNWVAPDGTVVRAEYLITGYGNGASLPNDAKALIRRVDAHVEEVGTFLFDDLLFMNGSDHLLPQRHLGRVLAEANELQNKLSFEVTSLPKYLAQAPTNGLQTWTGELRSGFRSNILMGVLSNRVDVKRLASVTERTIERRAEPYAALFADPSRYPDSLFRLAWREIIRNAAHDSICACSVDETVDAVLHRFNEARQIAAGLAKNALESWALSIRTPGFTVINPLSRPRAGVVEIAVGDDQFDSSTMQVVETRNNLPDTMLLDADAMRSVLSIIQGTQIDATAWIHEATLDANGDELTLDVTIGSYEHSGVELAPLRQELYNQLGANPSVLTRVTLIQPTIRRIIARTGEVPAFGWSQLIATVPLNPVSSLDSNGLTNSLVTVDVDAKLGTFSINGLAGFGRLVDGGDLGDSYNYSPPAHDQIIDAPLHVDVFVTEAGPVRGKLVVVATYQWPERTEEIDQIRVGATSVVVTTTIELRADEKTVRVETTFVNSARDHRVRVHLPIGTPTNLSRAECAFTVVTRGLTAEGRSQEFGLPTFPSRRFLQAGDLSVAHEGLHEYELVDIHNEVAHEVALTLLRSTGMLSRLGMAYRPLPAGPMTPVEGLQMIGRHITSRYAIVVGDFDPYALADDFLVPLDVVVARGGGTTASSGSQLDVRGAQVSAVRRIEGVLEVRVFNPSDESVLVEIPLRHGWLVDLRGQGVAPFDGEFELRPHGIATLHLSDG